MPSDILSLRAELAAINDDNRIDEEAVCWDFDEAVMDFWEAVEAKQQAMKPGKLSADRKLKEGQDWVPVYSGLDAILEEYDEAHQIAERRDPVLWNLGEEKLDAVVADANAVVDEVDW